MKTALLTLKAEKSANRSDEHGQVDEQHHGHGGQKPRDLRRVLCKKYIKALFVESGMMLPAKKQPSSANRGLTRAHFSPTTSTKKVTAPIATGVA